MSLKECEGDREMRERENGVSLFLINILNSNVLSI